MEKSNIIISIIIVLCIAAGVTAYGLTNNDNAIFSDLSGMGSDGGEGSGIGNNTNNLTIDDTDGGSGSSGSGVSNGGSGSSGSGSGSGSGTGSGSGSGHSSSGSSSGGSSSGGGSSGGSTKQVIGTQKAKSIAASCIKEAGCYAGTPKLSGSSYYVPILASNGTQVGGVEINAYTGAIIGEG